MQSCDAILASNSPPTGWCRSVCPDVQELMSASHPCGQDQFRCPWHRSWEKTHKVPWLNFWKPVCICACTYACVFMRVCIYLYDWTDLFCGDFFIWGCECIWICASCRSNTLGCSYMKGFLIKCIPVLKIGAEDGQQLQPQAEQLPF